MRRDSFKRSNARRADSGVDSITVNGLPAGGVSGPVSIVSPMALFVTPNIIRIDNGNEKALPDPFVSADINTELNNSFLFFKTGVTAVPAPPAPLMPFANGRKITFTISSLGAGAITWTGGLNGYSFANVAGIGPFQADFDALIAAMPIGATVKIGFEYVGNGALAVSSWVCVALAGYWT